MSIAPDTLRLHYSSCHGNIFMTSLGLLLLVSFIAASLFYRVERESLVASSSHHRALAYNAAETGLEVGKFWLEDRAAHDLYPDNGTISPLQIPSPVSGVAMVPARSGECHGYARFNSLQIDPGDGVDNDPATDLGPTIDPGLRLLDTTPVATTPCTLLPVPETVTLERSLTLQRAQYDFVVEALPRTTYEASGEQVGVSVIYGYSGESVAYPYRIRAVGRHHPVAAAPFDPTDEDQARFDQQVVLDLWVHYEH